MTPHFPHRGSDVEAWLIRQRDEWASPNLKIEDHPSCWYALDGVLDDYRLHADTGTPLRVVVSDGG
jgi:hypothetical protein